MSETVFSKIIRKEIPAKIVYEDQWSLAFEDIHPQAPTHVLVIPKQPIRSLADAMQEDKELLGHLQWVVAHVTQLRGLNDSGYRVVTNIGNDGGQSVPHLHYHILGGRALDWPPG
ncbi:MAG: histidine triad nucleotide-binding protein [Planctomycetaceae bacterium]|nr:histidine triad nucleotide-binding protein [Planctomycetaceae bacterium]